VLMRVYLAFMQPPSRSLFASADQRLRLLLVFVPCSPAGPDLASPSRLADVKDLSIITARLY
jgi:hypothetical protein